MHYFNLHSNSELILPIQDISAQWSEANVMESFAPVNVEDVENDSTLLIISPTCNVEPYN